MNADDALPLALDLSVARPKYEQLKERLVEAIRRGELAPGSALPTEKQLAEQLGIARSTVRQAMSALEHDGLIRRIQGKGTFVQQAARQRLSQEAGLLALVVPETRAGFYPSLLHGFAAAARELECQTIVCQTDNDVDKQGNAILQLIDKRIAGVTIVPTSSRRTPLYQIRQLRAHDIPVVFCHRRVAEAPGPLLALAYEQIGRMAGRHLAEQGHRRAALMASHRSETTDLYERGFVAAMREAGGDVPADAVWHASSFAVDRDADDGEVAAALQRLLDMPQRPTAIFASFDSLAETIHLQLTRMGLRVPEDISLIGVGDSWRDSAFARRLTSVTIDEASTARRAVELLAEILRGERDADDEETFELPARLYAGHTVARWSSDAEAPAAADTWAPHARA